MPSGSRVDAKHQFRNLGIMKKTYITPKIKAVKVQASTIICTSPTSIYNEKVDEKAAKDKYSDYEDEIGVAW